MKKTVLFLLLILISASFVQAQSTERFIRIIGNAKKEIRASKAKVQFSVSAQKASSYNETSKDVSLEEAYSATMAELAKNGVSESDVQPFIKGRSSLGSAARSYYFIIDFDKLEKINQIQVAGFNMADIKYIFEAPDENLETQLSLEAINDAKRKAKAICDEINKEVGKILNIEIKEAGFGAEQLENNKDVMIHSYRVAVTFKLVD